MTMITNNDNDKTRQARQATLADVAQFRQCLHWGVEPEASRGGQGEGGGTDLPL